MTPTDANARFGLAKMLFALTLLLLFSSCDSRKVFEQNFTIENDSWNSSDFKRFTFSIQDTSAPYNFYINLRNSTEYPWSNLFLFIRTVLPDNTGASDTLDLMLANPDGMWLGSGIGKYRDSQVLIMNDFKFPEPGEYAFEIEHGMRDVDISGISSVGIRVEKSFK